MASLKTKSVFLSLILRHKPEVVGLTLDAAGWINCDELVEAVATHSKSFTKDDLVEIVNDDDKCRYSFSECGVHIRANQGHSIEVDVDLNPTYPPKYLFHGTAAINCGNIRKEGINSGSRLHVHMSEDVSTATTVGSRHGVPAVLTIDAERMANDGVELYRSANGVWLTNFVDMKYIME